MTAEAVVAVVLYALMALGLGRFVGRVLVIRTDHVIARAELLRDGKPTTELSRLITFDTILAVALLAFMVALIVAGFRVLLP